MQVKRLTLIISLLATMIYGEVRSQRVDITCEFYPDSSDFWYELNDSTVYKGSAFICSLPFEAHITTASWDMKSNTLDVEGLFGFIGLPTDSSIGIDGASIFLYNSKTKTVKDIGETLTAQASGKPYDGYFKITIPIEAGYSLLIGISGETGVTYEYDLGKIVLRAKTSPLSSIY
jgi:hypothetical protein